MTKLRLARQDEYPALEALAESKGLGKPVFGVTFVLEEDGKIKGFACGRLVGLIDTMVADTPQSTSRLFTAIEASLMVSAPDADHFAIVTNPDAGNQLRAQGYSKVLAEFFLKRR